MLRRRSLLTAGAVASGIAIGATSGKLAAPAVAQGASARTLRFVPHANLAAVDPVATSGYIVRNFGFMIYDTLFGVDPSFQVRPQMVEGHEVSADGRHWRFRLREGLRFHDNEPVRARDAVASMWVGGGGAGRAFAEAHAGSAPTDANEYHFSYAGMEFNYWTNLGDEGGNTRYKTGGPGLGLIPDFTLNNCFLGKAGCQ